MKFFLQTPLMGMALLTGCIAPQTGVVEKSSSSSLLSISRDTAPVPGPVPTSPPRPTAPAPTTTTTPSPIPTAALPDGLMGYAMLDGTTTGGAGGPTVIVKTLSELRNAVADSSPRIVKVSGIITGSDTYISVGSNKSIIGIKGAEIHEIGLYMFGSSNIIIQNLKLYDGDPTSDNGGVGYSTFSVKEGAHHVWIDHVEMYPSENRDNGHTMAGVTHEAHNVTISWSSMTNKYTGLLVGAGGSEKPGVITLTLHHCLFDKMLERQPKAQNAATIHAFNNYFRNSMTEGHTAVGITATQGSVIRTDANYFENFKGVPISTQYNYPADAEGYVGGLETNYKDSQGAYRITTPPSTWMPPYSYSNYLTPVADVPATVLKGVGAILDIQ